MRAVEATGRNVNEAIESALDELKVNRDQVEIEVLSEGAKGLFGLLGSRQARVLVTVKETIEAQASKAIEFVGGVLQRMGLISDLSHELLPDDVVQIDIKGDKLGLVIGRRGQTLDALQYLTNLAVNRSDEGGSPIRARIVLDAEGYRERRAAVLRDLALRMSEKAKATGRKAVLEPMNAMERRIVHLALEEDQGIVTRSEGDDPHRRVVIIPKS